MNIPLQQRMVTREERCSPLNSRQRVLVNTYIEERLEAWGTQTSPNTARTAQDHEVNKDYLIPMRDL
jgi:hypothetical protein